MQDGILSIQSAVAYGHVGNSAAVFPLQRLGFEVWPVNTVLFSNHTGYGAWRGRVVGLDWVEEIVEGIADRGAIPRTRAVLSGYLGDYDGHRQLRAPMLALSFADDPFAPQAAVAALHREYAGAAVRHRHLRPAEAGVSSIGHFGFFKPGVPALWSEAAAWLERPSA